MEIFASQEFLSANPRIAVDIRQARPKPRDTSLDNLSPGVQSVVQLFNVQLVTVLASVPGCAGLPDRLPTLQSLSSGFPVDDHMERLSYLELGILEDDHRDSGEAMAKILPFIENRRLDGKCSAPVGKIAYNAWQRADMVTVQWNLMVQTRLC